MSVSLLEKRWREFFSIYFSYIEFEYNVRPNFLKYPATGRNLELDLFCPSLSLAIEIDGDQHLRYTPKFHKCKRDPRCFCLFLYQVMKDDFKDEVCRDLGIRLIRITTNDKEEDIYKKVKRYLLTLNKN